MDYQNSYIGNLFNAISQLGNALIGGKSDISISARIGYNALKRDDGFWIYCAGLVDCTFYPVDGDDHCLTAYQNDINEDYDFEKGGIIGLIFMSIILLVFCLPLSIIFWSWYFIKELITKK